MSYCTPVDAKEIVGVEIAQVLLNEACAIIHNYTPYRWQSTSKTDTLSGNGIDDTIHLNAPILSVVSLYVDDVEKTEDVEFTVAHRTGIIKYATVFPKDNDNIVVSYTYGFTESDSRYNDTIPIVIGAEARIALFLKKNPLFMSNLGVSGASLMFSNDALYRLLSPIPRPAGEFTAI